LRRTVASLQGVVPMCIQELPERPPIPWALITKVVIFVVVLGFALIALMINPEAVAAGGFITLVIAAAVKAGMVVVAGYRTD
jgi:small-conductance mechanosensitive channel